jgi:hypothetical protein
MYSLSDKERRELYSDIPEEVLTIEPIEKAYHVLSRISAGIGLVAAVGIIVETYVDHNAGGSTTNYATITRILFLLAMCLAIINAMLMIGATAADKLMQPAEWGAMGTMATCNAQGVICTFASMATFALDVFLSIAYVLIIRYNWSPSRLRRLETYMHATVWPIALTLAVPPLFLELYNPGLGFCYPHAAPLNCIEDECIRGQQLTGFIFGSLMMLVLAADVLLSIACMISIYLHAKRLEARNDLYASGSTQFSAGDTAGSLRNLGPSSQRRSTRVAWQGFFISGSVVVSKVPITIILWVTYGVGHTELLDIFAMVAANMYGVLLFLLFARHRKQMRTAYGRVLRRILCSCRSCRVTGAVRFCCCLDNPALPSDPEEQPAESVNNPELPDIKADDTDASDDPDPTLLLSDLEEHSA